MIASVPQMIKTIQNEVKFLKTLFKQREPKSYEGFS